MTVQSPAAKMSESLVIPVSRPKSRRLSPDLPTCQTRFRQHAYADKNEIRSVMLTVSALNAQGLCFILATSDAGYRTPGFMETPCMACSVVRYEDSVSLVTRSRTRSPISSTVISSPSFATRQLPPGQYILPIMTARLPGFARRLSRSASSAFLR